jgi:hypothetical protein
VAFCGCFNFSVYIIKGNKKGDEGGRKVRRNCTQEKFELD